MLFSHVHSLYNRSGFTVIELLVTIAIIAILASVVILNFTDARAVARDNVRMTDLDQIRVALALYRSENGAYPDGDGVICTNRDECEESVWSSNLNTALEEYLGTSIFDPRQTPFDTSVPSDEQFWYYYHNNRECEDGSGFRLVTIHARSMEIPSHRNAAAIQENQCANLDGTGHGLGGNGDEAYVIVVDRIRE